MSIVFFFSPRSLSRALLQLGARLALQGAAHLRLALVVQLFTTSHAYFKFDAPPLQVDAGDDERHPLRRRGLVQAVDLAPVQEEFACARGVVVEAVAVRVVGDVRVEEPGLA